VVDFCRSASPAEMERLLGEADGSERPDQIVHFDGHGSFDPVGQTRVLYFERAHVGSVLATSHSEHVEAVKVLLARFYAKPAGGATLGQAVRKTRATRMTTAWRRGPEKRAPPGRSVGNCPGTDAGFSAGESAFAEQASRRLRRANQRGAP
jgi:hypothetical protein